MNEHPENELRRELWEELKMVQTTIDKFDDISMRIKNWFITVFLFAAGFAFVTKNGYILLLNFLLIPIFYVYEVSYRTAHNAFLTRSDEIQEMLRKEDEMSAKGRAPHISPYAIGGEKNDNTEIWREAKKRISQLRISFLYWGAFAFNALLLIVYYFKVIKKDGGTMGFEQYITRPHLGILFTILGTVLLAFSLKIVRQYEGKDLRKVVEESKKQGMMELTGTSIKRVYFYSGLFLIAAGALLQW